MSRTPREIDEEYPLGPALDFIRRVSALNHALERVSSQMDRTLGVTAQQRLVLRCVGRYPGITAGQLARALHLDPGTISASLRRLEERLLVERRSDPRDKRRVVLGLTAEGRALDKPTAGTVEDAVQRLLDEVPGGDVATTASVLQRLSTILLQAQQTAEGSTRELAGPHGDARR